MCPARVGPQARRRQYPDPQIEVNSRGLYHELTTHHPHGTSTPKHTTHAPKRAGACRLTKYERAVSTVCLPMKILAGWVLPFDRS